MILWRLRDDHLELKAGSCITDGQFKSLFYLDKAMWEPIQEYEQADLLEYENEVYCIEKGIQKMLFYNEQELYEFLKGDD